jgi:hypothetical protein
VVIKLKRNISEKMDETGEFSSTRPHKTEIILDDKRVDRAKRKKKNKKHLSAHPREVTNQGR